MHIDILTRDDLPYTFENYAASKVKRELEARGVYCRHVNDLGLYLHEVRQTKPDWTLAFGDLLGWETPLCDILAVPHFHWEKESVEGLEHLQKSALCEIGFHQKKSAIHYLPAPAEPIPPQKKIFETILFLDLKEETRHLVEQFETRIDVFGDHRGPNWLVRLKNRDHVFLHMPLPFAEQLRALAMSHFVIMDETNFLYPLAIMAGCLPVQKPLSERERCQELDRLTKMVCKKHSWALSTTELLKCLSR